MSEYVDCHAPKISVLIPCFNVGKFLHQCLDSVIDQSFRDMEIICINDGSTDTTLDILRQYAAKDSRIKIINKPNSGYGDSMNQALDIAVGKYIGIVESDDFIDKQMFESLFTVAEKHNLDIARCGYFFFSNGIDTPQRDHFITKNIIITPPLSVDPSISSSHTSISDYISVFYQIPSIWANLYRNSWLKDKRIRFLPTPGASYQDTSFNFKCLLECRRFLMLDKCYLHYRQHPDSSVNSKGKVFAVCDEWNEIWRWFKKEKRSEQVRKVLLIRQMDAYRWNYLRLSTANERNNFLKRWSSEMKLLIKEDGVCFIKNKKKFLEMIVIVYFPFLYPLINKTL